MGSVSKDVVVNLGLISFTTRVESAQYTEDFLTNVCTGHGEHEPIAVSRPLHCDTCGPINMSGLQKAKKEAGGLVLLADSEVASLKEDATPWKGRVQLIPYDSGEVLANTGQGEKYYFLVPQTSPENYALIKQLILAYPGKAFVAKYAVRTKSSIFMAQVKGDCILLQERTFVDRLKPLPVLDTQPNEAFVGLAISMVESMAEEFNPATFEDSYSRALVDITRSRPVIGGKVAVSAPQNPQVTADLVRSALMEYRVRTDKMSEVAQDI